MAGQARLVEWLAAAGVTDIKLARRVHSLLGDDAPARLQSNPWCLVPLLKWKTVDDLGLRLRREAGAPDPAQHLDRLVGAADAVFKDIIGEGSTATTPENFRERLADKLGVSSSAAVVNRAHLLAIEHRAAVPGPEGLLRAPGCALMENTIVERLRLMANQAPSRRIAASLDAFLGKSEALHAEQRAAVQKVLSGGFTCLRGGAGTGKTHVARAICQIWEDAGGDLLLAAVAGKAALRLSRSTGRLARTLFRTLRELDEREAIERKLTSPDLEPSERDLLTQRLTDLAAAGPNTLVIIDESSMLDLSSMHGLLRRLPDGARVLLIGDEKQLPPVGFGLLYHRFVLDVTITASLTTIHRQADGSGIPAAAAVIRCREMPDLPAYAGIGNGISMVMATGREAIAEATVQIHADMGGRTGDILIVTPVNDGPCGVIGLNRRLHDAHVRATGLQELRGSLGDIFSAGEPLLHCRNNYKRGLFNGSMGIVRRIDRVERQIVATFDGEEHVFAVEDLVDLALGYALTCHRAQGSEADYVIVALPPSRLLDPSWLYTAITRARKQVVIVGQPGTMTDALQRPYADERRAVGLVWESRLPF